MQKPFTHDAYIFKNEGLRKGRRLGLWIKEGQARVEADGSLFVYLHSTPLGGFDGRVKCVKLGSPPPEEKPQRPGEDADAGQGAEDPVQRLGRHAGGFSERLDQLRAVRQEIGDSELRGNVDCPRDPGADDHLDELLRGLRFAHVQLPFLECR